MIKGFRGTSLVDYPGKIASVVFLGGCNWRCPYCYNLDLVLPERLAGLPDLPEEEILGELSRRQGFIRGVVITGGEPTLWERRLRAFLERIKYEVGLPIKLDTNGSRPEILEGLLKAELLDYLAVDFKTSPVRYAELGGHFEPVARTLELLKAWGDRGEVRITLVPALLSPQDWEAMLPYLEGVPRVALQRFVPEVPRLDPDFPSEPTPREEAFSWAERLRKELGCEVLLRL